MIAAIEHSISQSVSHLLALYRTQINRSPDYRRLSVRAKDCRLIGCSPELCRAECYGEWGSILARDEGMKQ